MDDEIRSIRSIGKYLRRGAWAEEDLSALRRMHDAAAAIVADAAALIEQIERHGAALTAEYGPRLHQDYGGYFLHKTRVFSLDDAA